MKGIAIDQTDIFVPPGTLTEAWTSVFRDPAQFVRHWNYKGAILSASLRAPIFFITYLIGNESLKLAIAVSLVQFAFRFLFAGLSGAVIQSFRRVEPPWKALDSVLLVIPFVSHLFEYLLQAAFVYVTSTADHTNTAIVRSVCVSIISVLFVLFIMRRNVMIVSEAESRSLLSDMKRMPALIFEFTMFIPNEIALMLRRKAILLAVASFAGFGVFSEMIVWGVTNKWYWTYGGGKHIEGLRFWAVDGMIILAVAVIFSLVFVRQTQRQEVKVGT